MEKGICRICGSEFVKKSWNSLACNNTNCKTLNRKLTFKDFKQRNKEKISTYNKIYRENNKKYFQEKAEEYRLSNPERRKISARKHYKSNKEQILEKNKIYRENNKEKIKLQKSYYNKSYSKIANKNYIERRKIDILFRLKCNYRSRISKCLSNKNYIQKTSTTFKLLGCSLYKFKNHLEEQFSNNMNWDNYGIGIGKWSIDHIIPLNEANNEDDLKNLCHYTNTQPLWFDDNASKGCKID